MVIFPEFNLPFSDHNVIYKLNSYIHTFTNFSHIQVQWNLFSGDFVMKGHFIPMTFYIFPYLENQSFVASMIRVLWSAGLTVTWTFTHSCTKLHTHIDIIFHAYIFVLIMYIITLIQGQRSQGQLKDHIWLCICASYKHWSQHAPFLRLLA